MEWLININYVSHFYCPPCNNEQEQSLELVTPDTRLAERYGE